MKQLSIEEKARRYDKALEKARQLCAYPTTKPFISDLQDLFPELKESEDDSVRKALIEFVQGMYMGCCTEEAGKERDMFLAWLEKQGEQKGTLCDTGRKAQPSHSCQDITALGRCALEKQDGQKPVDKVEPKFKVKYAGSEYNVLEVKDIAGVTFYGIEDEPNHIDYVQAENCERVDGYSIKESGSPFPTKPAKFSEQNSTWSEEDEKGLGDALWCCKQAASIAKDENDTGNVWFAENWLKSIKQRYTWKPSEEQLGCLSDAIKHYNSLGYPATKLKELLNDLKKLMEE